MIDDTSSRRRPRRSALEWAVRGGLAVLAGVIGYVSTTNSLAEVVRKRDPVRAHALAPGNGRVTAALAEQMFIEKGDGQNQSATFALARRALLQDPTAVSAVATLGLLSQLNGRQIEARKLLNYSQRLSRRDLRTQLWALEDAVSRSNVPEALRHYDVVLRTSRAASELLFPVLAGAVGDPVIRTNLVRTLAQKPAPAWGQSFIGYALANDGDPRAIAKLFVEMRRAGVSVAPEASASVINRLVLKGAVDYAWRYYLTVRPGIDPNRLRYGRFADNPSPASVFDWITVNDGSVVTSIQGDGQNGIFDFSARASIGGPLLKQMQMLRPGKYRLRGHSIGIDQHVTALPYWALVCLDGHELGRVVVSNSSQSNGVFFGRFEVPEGCRFQMLTLTARSSEAVSGLSGQIDWIELVPLR